MVCVILAECERAPSLLIVDGPFTCHLKNHVAIVDDTLHKVMEVHTAQCYSSIQVYRLHCLHLYTLFVVALVHQGMCVHAVPVCTLPKQPVSVLLGHVQQASEARGAAGAYLSPAEGEG